MSNSSLNQYRVIGISTFVAGVGCFFVHGEAKHESTTLNPICEPILEDHAWIDEIPTNAISERIDGPGLQMYLTSGEITDWGVDVYEIGFSQNFRESIALLNRRGVDAGLRLFSEHDLEIFRMNFSVPRLATENLAQPNCSVSIYANQFSGDWYARGPKCDIENKAQAVSCAVAVLLHDTRQISSCRSAFN